MKILIISLAAVCLSLVFIVVVGALLPKRHVVSLSATYAQSPEQIYAVIAGPPSWRPDVTREETTVDSEGRKLSRETDRHGRTVTYEIREIEPSRKLSRTIINKDLPYSGTWTYVLQPVGNGTELTITEDGEVKNPAFRFLSRFVFGHTSTIKATMIALGRAFGEK